MTPPLSHSNKMSLFPFVNTQQEELYKALQSRYLNLSKMLWVQTCLTEWQLTENSCLLILPSLDLAKMKQLPGLQICRSSLFNGAEVA